jgi:PilZ domain
VESETGNQGARDRRRHPRFADEAQVLCVADEGAGGFHQARLTELSADGMRILSGHAFAPGSQIFLGVFLEDAKEPLVLLGVVQHCEPLLSQASLGVQFLSVTDEQRIALEGLQHYLKRRHGAPAVVTVRPATAILRIRDESWW